MIDNSLVRDLCSPAAGPIGANAGACAVCPPKDYVTREEEAALAKMREIKDQVRSVNERIKQLQALAASDHMGPGGSLAAAEWNDLQRGLAELRIQWKEWQHKLDLAIERKLIMLGHRQP